VNTAPAFTADLDEYFEELNYVERVSQTRSRLLEHLASGIQALQYGVVSLEQLRGNNISDFDFAEGSDGRDVAAFLDDAIRYARAAYAVVHTVIDKQTS
jgi:hypothetical protein